MRAVAARVGVTPMALYPYVGNKAALLDGLVGRLLAELPVPGSTAACARAPRAPRARGPPRAPDDLPAPHRLAKWLDQPADWDAEFDADLRDLQRLIETVAAVGETNSRTGS